MNNLSFVTPIAYDYKYAMGTIRSYYTIANEIILGLDEDRISWSNNKFEFDDDYFAAFIKEIDKDNKITIAEGNFHSHKRPIDNDTDERQRLCNACKEGNWVIQIDSDETLQNPIDFEQWMKEANRDHLIKAEWITVYRIFGDDALVVERPQKAMIPVGSVQGTKLNLCRETSQPDSHSNLVLLHNSWGRTRAELKQKLENWGHSQDFDTDKYLELWDSIDMDNYQNYTNLHPLNGPLWPKLRKVKLQDYR